MLFRSDVTTPKTKEGVSQTYDTPSILLIIYSYLSLLHHLEDYCWISGRYKYMVQVWMHILIGKSRER